MSSRRARIGLTTYAQSAKWGVWDSKAAVLPWNYVTAVANAGGTPLLLPPIATDISVLDVLDGLIVVGGVDVDPGKYGAEPHPKTSSQPERDDHDIALTREALRRDLPLFAICRGAQILNVALGGTLHQHIPDLPAQSNYQPAPGVFGSVAFTTSDNSLAKELLGDSATAPCYHHQSIDQLGEGLCATAVAQDGTIEVVETTGPNNWVLGVQFHPEENGQDARLFEAFIKAAEKFSQREEADNTELEEITP